MTTRLSLLRNVGLLAAVALAAPLAQPSEAAAAMVCIVDYEDGIACAVCVEGNCWGAACSDGETTISTGGCENQAQ
ncbi:MAG TPA: hypothetical protein VE871_01310 [Longimicrobium sp.]|nr:hypothetical protein [Longimicrobium sp.]